MPRFDGTGPMGLGRMTGHGNGHCSGAYSRQNGDYGARFGRGGDCRRGNRPMHKSSRIPRWTCYKDDIEEVPLDEEKFLRERVKLLENQLKPIKEQLEKLNKDDGDNSEEVDSL